MVLIIKAKPTKTIYVKKNLKSSNVRCANYTMVHIRSFSSANSKKGDILLAWLLASGESDARKVVWIILLILYIIYLIFSIIASLVLVGIPDLLLSIFLVTYLLSPDVKGKCGM